MKKTLASFISFVLVSLFGCSNTTIHLHANNMPEAEKENIRLSLEKQGFSVRMRDNESPSSGNIILYYPHEGIEEDLHAIDKVLEAKGLKAERGYAIHTEKLGKHEYTAGNIGLYIAPTGPQEQRPVKSRVRSIFPMTMTGYEFVSMDCEQEYLYEFFEEGKLAASDPAVPADEVEMLAFDWQSLPNDIIMISNGREQFKYKKIESHIEHSSEHSHYVVTYNIRLQPLDYYRVPFGCMYKSTYFESF
jgi:hypothetical protein